jgi:glycosyltransferase involved in cell wall biosynthesis
MKKILFLIHDLGYGGAERVLVNLVNALDKTKYEVFVQTLFDVGVNRDYLNDDVHYITGMKKVFKGNATLMKLLSPKTLAKIVIKDDYDLVISYLEGPCSRIVSGHNGKKAAWIHTVHTSPENMAAHFRSIDEMKNAYDSYDNIFCVADTVRDNFKEISKTTSECITLYNVNDTDEIIKKSAENQNTIVKTDNQFNIVTCGRLINNIKGFDRMIKIHKKLLDDGINNKLYILGEGPDKDDLISLIDNLGVKESCFLLGFQNNPYKYIKAADLFVCSSYVEGFSTAVTEALVLGVACVSTDVSGAFELLGKSNEYGIVCDKSDEALYSAIKNMLDSRQTLEKYSLAAEERGKEFYSKNAVENIEIALDKLLR